MTGQWSPGDVVLWDGDTRFNAPLIMFRHFDMLAGKDAWMTADQGGGYPSEKSELRPLVVIDPEDREQARRLLETYGRQFTDWTPDLDSNVTRLQAALREFADPTPPKPDEPLGRGAVVVDANGLQWVRDDGPESGGLEVWYRRREGPCRSWASLEAVEVLSEGVTS